MRSPKDRPFVPLGKPLSLISAHWTSSTREALAARKDNWQTPDGCTSIFDPQGSWGDTHKIEDTERLMSIVGLRGQYLRSGCELDQALVLLQFHCWDIRNRHLQKERPRLWEHLEHLWTAQGKSMSRLLQNSVHLSGKGALRWPHSSHKASCFSLLDSCHQPWYTVVVPQHGQTNLHDALNKTQPKWSGLTAGMRAPRVDVVRGGSSGNWQRKKKESQ